MTTSKQFANLDNDPSLMPVNLRVKGAGAAGQEEEEKF